MILQPNRTALTDSMARYNFRISEHITISGEIRYSGQKNKRLRITLVWKVVFYLTQQNAPISFCVVHIYITTI